MKIKIKKINTNRKVIIVGCYGKIRGIIIGIMSL